MLIPPKYVLTSKVAGLLSSIESAKQVVDSIIIPAEIEINIRRASTLKSSLFSARIEGNDLTLIDLPKKSSKDQKKVEVFNILKALNLIHARPSKDLVIKDLLGWHQIVMDGLIQRNELGHFRNQASAIFNSAGIAIYLPPTQRRIEPHLNKLLSYINGQKENFIAIRAVLAHYIFEKIHPFLDGNGRVGRLLLQAVLAKGGYGMKGLLAVEEYLDNHRFEYYKALEDPERDVTGYLEFMLEAVAQSAKIAKELILIKKEVAAEDFLLPRRAEMLNIIQDQKLVNFDQIRRRFLGVNERTLRFDLKKLQDGNFIKKRGTTKGVYYEIIK